MDAQIDNFANTRHDIISSIGVPGALKLFKNALFSVTIGSNDFINNYLAPNFAYSKYKSDSPEIFVTTLISKLQTQLTVIFLAT